MIPAAFDYRRAESVEDALALLAGHGEEAKILAGGHSLLPLMKLRLARPDLLIDVGGLRELRYVRREDDHLAIGALTRHRDLEASELVQASAPILARAAGLVGDPQVRHRGTIGGSLAHADPAGDLPAVVLALRASVVVRGPEGERLILADQLFRGFLETAIEPGELLTEVRVPIRPGGWSFHKFSRRALDWAIVGAAVVLDGDPSVTLVNMGATPIRARATEEALGGGAPAAEAAELAADGLQPPSDIHATASYRRHLAKVLVRRGLEEAGAGVTSE